MSDTLLIKHLPDVLGENEKKELLRHFGAKEVKCIISKQNKYNIAFARFENQNVAENVLHRLHQLNILGSRLTVEYAKKENFKSDLLKQQLDCTETKEDKENEKLYQQFIDKLASWHLDCFKQPVPSHLKYQYPPPNVQTLVNIIKVLAVVPKFYTQVLHLMNKMNLPCPFGKDVLPDLDLDIYPVSKNEEVKSTEDVVKNVEEETVETSESEISSDEELKNHKETIPKQYKLRKKMKIKVPKFFKPPVVPPPKNEQTRKATFDEVFEKVTDEKEPKKIKLSHMLPVSKPVEESPAGGGGDESATSTSGFGFIHPLTKETTPELPKDTRDEREEERLEKEVIVCISEAELAENRISEKDRSVLPVFKSYAEGAPTCRLYIKNLSKSVTEQDLRYIYNRYLSASNVDEPSMFDIRLMQEGRMKGQAFVTLQTVELAQKALKETNGYILKDKPLVVQFARSATK